MINATTHDDIRIEDTEAKRAVTEKGSVWLACRDAIRLRGDEIDSALMVALQSLEFRQGKRKRGRDIAFVIEEIKKAKKILNDARGVR